MSDFNPILGRLTDARSTLTHDKTCSLNVHVGSARVCDCHMAVIVYSNQRIAELEAQNKRLVELVRDALWVKTHAGSSWYKKAQKIIVEMEKDDE